MMETQDTNARPQEPEMPQNAMTPDTDALRRQLAERTERLHTVAATLKQELFGIDAVIDRVIESVRAWYVLPQIVTRPVIVCLWGLTGTGKTQLVRRLTQLLGFYDRFVEVQMDGFSHGASHWGPSAISGMLAQSGVPEGAPGVLVLDEFQRYRTVDKQANDVKVERYQDVWALLSDGKLPPPLSLLGEIESSIASAAYDADQADDDGEDDEEGEKDGKKKPARRKRFRLSTWQAEELRRNLKLREPLTTVMAWSPDEVLQRLRDFRESQQHWETDYSRLLVFVCGNLDGMYEDMATRVEDCDTDADVFHELTRKLSVIDVKKALAERFRPEQIARLGNNHVVYPSLSRAAYEQLIRRACARYVEEAHASAGVGFELHDSVYAQLYANGVFPAQGTRPLFSSVHAILSAMLVNAALWALECGASAGERVQLRMCGTQLQARLTQAGVMRERSFEVPLDLNQVRRRAGEDFRALLAVHEAGHGLAYALLFGRPPLEIKINLASFEGGYNSYAERKAWSRQNLLDGIAVTLAGRAAEQLVFGEAMCSSGAEADLRKATASAARFVRHLGFAGRLSRTDVTTDADDNLNTDIAATNVPIEALLGEQMARVSSLLDAHRASLLAVVDELLAAGAIAPMRFAELLGLQPVPAGEWLDGYAAKLALFRMQPLLARAEGTDTAAFPRRRKRRRSSLAPAPDARAAAPSR
ncbi:AAA family ATPase [Xenophilus sp. Marseille-Q4582]|uniref:AAA family ATPase n=1 Tax=Xenophilus sp. Marseille-Q4582 TaxID=2866600 RepID=UPI001CE3E741|nr:AAA family ATPase [Xenophilus sp. Marseille-Q4582]